MLGSLRNTVLGLGIAVTAAFGAGTVPDTALQAKAVHEIRMYPQYSIFDNINVRVANGNIELLGQVSEPYKKQDLLHIMQHIRGVASVTNDLEVLPLSPMDNRIRWQVARAIYSDPVLSRYSMEPVGSIHIIVANGHVTLEGVVSNEMERNVAALRASGAGLSFGPVINNLRVEVPSRKS
ncbi:MAG TPA: transport-associated protein [Solibacterales bacterium]|nr:transport-associated protein [Bryobacterales bacterium]